MPIEWNVALFRFGYQAAWPHSIASRLILKSSAGGPAPAMRIPVSVTVKQVAHGATCEEVLSDYPDLDDEDIQPALEHTSGMQ